jgi:hypothetical protein
MDTAVALVQCYLNVNGYFTVAEYPVLEAGRHGPARAVTDLDILGFRFPGAGHEIIRDQHHLPLADARFLPDRLLDCPGDRPDMIVGEVKEGAARFNAATRDPVVLEVALARFGCCEPARAGDLARRLLSRGQVTTPAGHQIRMVAFGAGHGETGRWKCVPMAHVVRFLRSHLREHWELLRHAQMRDTPLAMLALLEKWGAESAAGGDREGADQ